MDNLYEFLASRHSVRSYLDTPLTQEQKTAISDLVNKLNTEHQLEFKVVYDDLTSFNSLSLGLRFKAANYIIFYDNDPVKAGYYSVPLLLKIHELGLGSCYLGTAIMKGKMKDGKKKVQCILGFANIDKPGHPHKNKDPKDLVRVEGEAPANLDEVVKIAMSAPTAMNRQGFVINTRGGEYMVEKTSNGPFANFDLGIIRYYVDLALNKVKLD